MREQDRAEANVNPPYTVLQIYVFEVFNLSDDILCRFLYLKVFLYYFIFDYFTS